MADETVDYAGPIVTRANALAQGLNRYFDGRLCGKGHRSQRNTARGTCALCGELRVDAYNLRHNLGRYKPMCQTPGCNQAATRDEKTLCFSCYSFRHRETLRAKTAFENQFYSAKSRGIPLLFSFAEWVSWWENALGADWFEKRGCTKGKFCMARLGDKGAYEPSNVICILHTDNVIDAASNDTIAYGTRLPQTVLNEEIARNIYLSMSTNSQLSELYGVCRATIRAVRSRRNWRRATAGLEQKTLLEVSLPLTAPQKD